MGIRIAAFLTVLTVVLGTLPRDAAAQRHVLLAPTYQQSVAAYDSGVLEPVSGPLEFRAWGFMVGLQRPGSFWQPHLWIQRYELGQPCEVQTDLFDCTNDGWSVSVGPGLEVIDTPRLTGLVLPQVGFQGRGAGLTGGVGLHMGVRVGAIQPAGFARYHVVRGVHYGTLGVGLIFRLPLSEG
ncbi:MAG TPA: hypothetical protein VLL48_12785 [Longimicrobiales bacterium]|nr:hypothetical protein [Longimicrobiales bacterium]